MALPRSQEDAAAGTGVLRELGRQVPPWHRDPSRRPHPPLGSSWVHIHWAGCDLEQEMARKGSPRCAEGSRRVKPLQTAQPRPMVSGSPCHQQPSFLPGRGSGRRAVLLMKTVAPKACLGW
ncbi:uncharacterized protein LOC117199884 isoform X3 [Orcinus orca]|uniref:uncharacterized protein LOC117199884 isoform X3 n=1 Tax=Orcinus orca TaxID=9733 RepID=UPI002112B7A1|nr:uncharacterized protein LOC117199884 isoform X3 [Orcinus orca]